MLKLNIPVSLRIYLGSDVGKKSWQATQANMRENSSFTGKYQLFNPKDSMDMDRAIFIIIMSLSSRCCSCVSVKISQCDQDNIKGLPKSFEVLSV